jgi:hypothetical protein
LAVLVASILAVSAAEAQFIWLVPQQLYGPNAKVIFSDNLDQGDPDLITRISQTRLWMRDGSGKESRMTWTKAEEGFLLEVPGMDLRTVGGTCTYGVTRLADSKPFLLHYYPKMIIGDTDKGDLSKPWDLLTFEIVPRLSGNDFQLRLLFKGKVVPNPEFFLIGPGTDQPVPLKAKKGDILKVGLSGKGTYAIRATMIEEQAGNYDGKKYEEIRHHATLVMDIGSARVDTEPAADAFLISAEQADKADQREEPAASRLLAEARAARANWTNFPGFTADLDINVDGTVQRGKLQVDAKGKITLGDIAQKDAEAWASRILGSLVSHRMDNSAERNTPCAFADQDQHHPFGRAINVLNDELHSSYRIKDRQILVVNREMGERKFTITVLENRLNSEKKYLPGCYVVNYWDLKTGELRSSEAHHNTWTRVGGFDLPAGITVLTAQRGVANDPGKADPAKPQPLTSRSITIRNHKLLELASK